MKNKLGDLNDHLFLALERLNDDALTPDQIDSEAKRADAIVKIADQLTENARTRLSAARLYAEHGDKVMPFLPQVGGNGAAKQIEGAVEK